MCLVFRSPLYYISELATLIIEYFNFAEADVDAETQELLTADFELGHYIRERIVPRAVLYFTGSNLLFLFDDPMRTVVPPGPVPFPTFGFLFRVLKCTVILVAALIYTHFSTKTRQWVSEYLASSVIMVQS